MNFSKKHGYARDVTSVTNKLHINSFRVVEGCSVVVEHEYLEPSVKIRKRTDPISLGDFDPAKIQVPPNVTDAANNPMFMVQMERSDSARKIQAAAEMSDGSKKTILLASEFFYMDSRDPAVRFKNSRTETPWNSRPAPVSDGGGDPG
jgi:hypothetical protein